MADKYSFLQMIYGERCVDFVNRERMNADEEFDKVLNDLFLELGEKHGFLYYDIAKLLLKENPQAEISVYLKGNSDKIARRLLAMSLRFLRHPHATRQFNPFFKYSHKLEDEEWDALELDILGHPAANDEETQKFIDGLKNALDKMSGDKIDAVLAVRFGNDVADKNDPAVIELYNAAMADLKAEFNQ